MRRYLPLALLATALVIALPAVLVASIVPRGGLWLTVASALSAVALSVATASVGAALWKRQPRSRDIVFADLMLWGWLRRCWTERRLSQARDLFDAARRAGPAVNVELLIGLSRLIEARDAYLHGHGRRVARYAVRIAHALGCPPAEIAKIRAAAEVHDVGKLYIPRTILNNPRRLTEAEFAVIKRHPVEGAEMLTVVGEPEITAMVRHHHERIDGFGYPDGLIGAQIPLGARIIAVADTFDAITSSRAYRPAGAQKEALDILSEVAGSQLDAVAVAAFLEHYSARRPVALYALAAAVPQRILERLGAVSHGLGASVAASAPILPAVGAAALLATSPGLHGHTSAARDAHRHPSAPQRDLVTNATSLTTRPLAPGAMRVHGARPHVDAPKHATARTSPIRPVSRSPTTRAQIATPTRAPAPASSPPSATTNAPPPQAGPQPTAPQPVGIVPTVPLPPITPPVSVPIVPIVTEAPTIIRTVPGVG